MKTQPCFVFSIRTIQKWLLNNRSVAYITSELERALKLLDLSKETYGSSSLVGPLCVEAGNCIIYSHNILQSMIGGERVPEMPEGTKLNRKMNVIIVAATAAVVGLVNLYIWATSE